MNRRNAVKPFNLTRYEIDLCIHDCIETLDPHAHREPPFASLGCKTISLHHDLNKELEGNKSGKQRKYRVRIRWLTVRLRSKISSDRVLCPRSSFDKHEQCLEVLRSY